MKEIIKEQKSLFYMMILMALIALGFLVYGLVTLSPSAALVKTQYRDIGSYDGGSAGTLAAAGGYQDGAWTQMLAFPALAVIVGVLHTIIAIKLYRRRGPAEAKVFVAMSIIVIIGAWITLGRLLGEG